MTRTVAIVPFYLPDQHGQSFLHNLARQTSSVDILIVDNSPSQVASNIVSSLNKTYSKLDAQTWEMKPGAKIHYLARPDNPGPGAAFALGMKAAAALGATHVWFLDQDMAPEADCLGQMLAVAAVRDGTAAATPSRTNPISGYAYRALRYGRFRQHSVRGTNASSPTEVDITVYSGFLLPMSMAASDLIPTEYFIDWDDIVMCIRIRKRGGRILFVPAAKSHHESGHQRKRLAPQLGIAIGTWRAFRYYYILRNHWYYGQELKSWLGRSNLPRRIAGQTLLLAFALVFGKSRKAILINAWRGLRDGRNHVTGKRPDRALGSP